MSSLQFFNAPNNDNNNMINNNDEDPILYFSTTDHNETAGLSRTPQWVMFDLDSIVEHALEITPNTQEEIAEFPDKENFLEIEQNNETHGIHGTNDTMIDETTKETDDPFYKACHFLSISRDLKSMVQVSMDLFNMTIGKENTVTIDDRIHIFGKQILPFAMLTVTANDNKIVVIHNISCLLVPLGY